MKRPPYKRPSENANNNVAMNSSPGNNSGSELSMNNIEDGLNVNNDSVFVYSDGLSSVEANDLFVKFGRNELPEKKTSLLYIFLSLLTEPMPCMIWIAIVIEAVLGKWMDMGILLGIQTTNASIAFYETTKSGSAVAALKASLRPEAIVKRDGKWLHTDAALLVPGDLVLLSTGSAVPADCRINDGNLEIDQSALTGESLPVAMYKGDKCMMGSTVSRGEVEATVEATGSNTFFGKTAALLQNSNEPSNLQSMLMDIMIILVLISITLCSVVYLHLAHITSVVEALSFTVVLMVASIPLAIEIVTTTTLALGSKDLSHHGAIVTRLSAIEDMAGMAILCSDKTGTMTQNKMALQEETPVYCRGENQYSILRYAAMASKWNEPPKDALDTLTLNAADLKSLDENVEQIEFVPFDPSVKRTEGTIRDKHTKNVFKVSKGAPHIICKLINDPNMTETVNKHVASLGERGIRSLAVARTLDNNVNEWIMLGLLTFLDPPREDTLKTIQDAYKYGVGVKMITGDHLLIAKETGRRLNLMGNSIYSAEGLPTLDPKTKQKPENLSENYGRMILAADGFAEVFPEHKYLIVECLRELGYKTGMTGDGVNDAPALKRADVGIAVQGATDAARVAADIVLTQPGLSTIIHGILISRCIFIRIRNFITYRIAATLQLLFFFFIAIFAFRPSDFEPEDQDDHLWPTFFHMPVIMLMLITLLNDGTLIAIGYDNVIAPETPAVWNLRVLFTVGIVLAAVACCSSLLLLQFSLESWQPNSFYQRIGLGGISYARAGDNWFWSSKPAPVLLIAACFALTTSTLVAMYWPQSRPDGIPTIGLHRKGPYILPIYIWIYCIVWWFIQDAAKVLTYRILERFNVFGYNDTGMTEQLAELHLQQARQRANDSGTSTSVGASSVMSRMLPSQLMKSIPPIQTTTTSSIIQIRTNISSSNNSTLKSANVDSENLMPFQASSNGTSLSPSNSHSHHSHHHNVGSVLGLGQMALNIGGSLGKGGLSANITGINTPLIVGSTNSHVNPGYGPPRPHNMQGSNATSQSPPNVSTSNHYQNLPSAPGKFSGNQSNCNNSHNNSTLSTATESIVNGIANSIGMGNGNTKSD